MKSLVGAGSPVEITLGYKKFFSRVRDVARTFVGRRLTRLHKRAPGGGKTRGSGTEKRCPDRWFRTISLARTLTRIIFLVPGLRSPRNPEGVANQEGYLRCSKRFDHIGVTLQVLALFEFKSVDERP